MTRDRLTLDSVKEMEFETLNNRLYGLLEAYESPQGETRQMLDDRIGRTLDELPDIYAWLLHLHAFFDHWTEFYGNQYGMKDLTYKTYRAKRDLVKNAASAAKLRYEGTSRRLTQLNEHEQENKMPRTRR